MAFTTSSLGGEKTCAAFAVPSIKSKRLGAVTTEVNSSVGAMRLLFF